MAQSYNYRARNRENQVVTGVVQSTSLDAAKKILLKNELTPINISAPRSLGDYLPFIGKVSLKQKTMFARQISTMIEAGLTLTQSMRLLIRQTKGGKFHNVLDNILNDLQDGFSFSTALSKHPDVFDTIFVNVVRSGEATGKLESVLQDLSTSLEKTVRVQSKIKGALIYPAFILTAMIGVAILMMVIVVPQLVSVFDAAGGNLPIATQILIALSNFFVNYWYLLIFGLVGTVVGVRSFLRTQTGVELFSKLSLRMPVVGGITEQSNMGRFGRLLSMLLGSGVPLLEALHLIQDSFSNSLYHKGIVGVAKQVERGVPMSVPISENPVFPIMVAQMVAVGEQTGKMDEIMSRLANYYEEEVETKVNGLTSLLEPIIIIMLGCGVAFLLVAILMPIYQMNNMV